MKIGLFGSSGFIGTFLKDKWSQAGHTLSVFQRKDPNALYYWEPKALRIDPSELEGLDLIINLAGEGISDGRWTNHKKEAILKSRVAATSLIASAIDSLSRPPHLWVNGSAIGYYGDRSKESLDESSSKGSLFLSQVVEQWESATQVSSKATRIITARFGMVIDPKGGALKKMILPFKLGLGGQIGNGNQWISWIALEDIQGAIEHLIDHPEVDGPVNFVTPAPVLSKVFTLTLAKVLNRPHFLPLPEWALRLAMGDLADELLLSSLRVYPRVLQKSHYHFKDPLLKKTLERLLE